MQTLLTVLGVIGGVLVLFAFAAVVATALFFAVWVFLTPLQHWRLELAFHLFVNSGKWRWWQLRRLWTYTATETWGRYYAAGTPAIEAHNEERAAQEWHSWGEPHD